MLLVTGLSACASSDDEWSGERTPSREAVDDVSEAKSEPEAAADDVPDAGQAAATDDVPKAEAEPEAAARANDEEDECRDYWLLDYDEEDKASNRREQVVFVLELNENTDSDREDGGSAKCTVSLAEIDWTSIRDVQRLFELIATGAPETIETENVSNTVKIDPNLIQYKQGWGDAFGYYKYDEIELEKSPGATHETFGSKNWTNQPNAAVLPSHDWQDFYQDQHLMTFGVCDAIDEEATVFFFDPNFIDEKYEYHKVWSEGSTITQRSLPAPRFHFPYKAEDAVQQPQLIGIKIVDVATKQPVGAALIEVFVTQVKTEAGKPTIEGGKPPEDLYGCKFDLHISRTYTKEVLEERAFQARIKKRTFETSKLVDSQLTDGWGQSTQYKYDPMNSDQLLMDSELSSWLNKSDVAISYATATEAMTLKWFADDKAWVPPNDYAKLKIGSIEELLVTVATHDGDPFSRQYMWLQTEENPNGGILELKLNSLLLHFQASNTKNSSVQMDDWKEFFKK